MSNFLGVQDFGFISGGASGTAGSAGTSGLAGDRYETTSSSTFTLGNSGTIIVGVGLAYSVAQSIIIAFDSSNFQECEVLAYNENTGQLDFGIPTRTVGFGTFNFFFVNLDGASGGDGTSGTNGTSGTSSTSGSSGTSASSGTSSTSGSSGTSASSGTASTSGETSIYSGTSGTSQTLPPP